jgi:hypothetical protein
LDLSKSRRTDHSTNRLMSLLMLGRWPCWLEPSSCGCLPCLAPAAAARRQHHGKVQPIVVLRCSSLQSSRLQKMIECRHGSLHLMYALGTKIVYVFHCGLVNLRAAFPAVSCWVLLILVLCFLQAASPLGKLTNVQVCMMLFLGIVYDEHALTIMWFSTFNDEEVLTMTKSLSI